MGLSREDGGLGFKDLRDFNIALLAKQTWRFLQKPGSLVCRVFKAKYFRECSVLEVELNASSHVSFAFRSILAGRNLLRSGLAWDIGTGLSVRVFRDKWVSRTDAYGLLTPCPMGMENILVADLMFAEARLWNVQRLEENFHPTDIAAITHMPIRAAPSVDRQYWHHSEDGVYSVATGYKAQLIRSKGEASSSMGHVNRPLLRKLWKLKVPKKCIFPVWRLWHGSIAVGSRFIERGMHVDAHCSLCDGHIETEEHLFINCSFTRKVWNEVRELQFISSWDKSLKDLIIYILSDLPISVCESFVMVIWGIWKGRNEFRFENKRRSEEEVRLLGLDQLLWFREANSVYGVAGAVGNGPSVWSPPPAGTYRINCDASCPNLSRIMGLGDVIRDSEGRFFSGRLCRRPKTRSVLLAELQAIWMGLQLAADLRLQHVSVQSDSLVAINLFRDGYSGRLRAADALAEMDVIIQSCKLLVSQFLSVSFDFISRSGNNLAHLFAQRGLVEDDISFYYVTPDWAMEAHSVELLGMTAQV